MYSISTFHFYRWNQKIWNQPSGVPWFLHTTRNPDHLSTTNHIGKHSCLVYQGTVEWRKFSTSVIFRIWLLPAVGTVDAKFGAWCSIYSLRWGGSNTIILKSEHHDHQEAIALKGGYHQGHQKAIVLRGYYWAPLNCSKLLTSLAQIQVTQHGTPLSTSGPMLFSRSIIFAHAMNPTTCLKNQC